MEEKSIMLNFLDTIKEISTLKPNLLHIEKLQAQLKYLTNFLIEENDAELLMECILKYTDFIINTSSSKKFRDQIKICRESFGIITEIIPEHIQTTFVKVITKRIFDIVIEDDVKSWCVKKELLKAYISCIQRVNKNIRQEVVQELPKIYLFKMVDSISTYGDYDLQVTLIETVFRMYGKSIITSKLKDLIPESEQLSERFVEINGDTFDEDVRNFLNVLNEKSGKVFSVICKSVHLGNIKCGEPMDNVNGLWVDFNLSEHAITWYCNKNSFSENRIDAVNLNESNNRVWNLITLFVSDVESVQIHRSVKSEDVLIYFKFKESCISSFDDNQTIIGAAKNLKLVISCDSKKSLLSKVLPYLFKDKFFHNSSKVSSSKKSIYKPLNVIVSRKAISNSPKSKSDASSFVTTMDPISRKSGKSDLSTIKDDISQHKTSPMNSKCDVISIPDSSTTATEVSLDFAPIIDQISQKVHKSIDSEYETAETCPSVHLEVNPKVINMNKSVNIKISTSEIDNSLYTRSSFNDKLLDVQQDIDQIQILSRRCTGSDVRYSQSSKNSKLTASASMKLSTLSRYNEDQITRNCLYSDENKENIATDRFKVNFQTTINENEQLLTKATKISKSTDTLWKPKIDRENMTNESCALTFETAEDQLSNQIVKVSVPKDISCQYFQKVLDNNLNLNKPIRTLKHISSEGSDILKENLKSTITLHKKLHIKSDICNLAQKKNQFEETTDVKNALFDGNLGINPESTANDRKCLKATEDIVLLDSKNSVVPIKISKPVHSSWSKTEIRKLKNPILNRENDEAITKCDISDTVNVINEHSLAKMVLKSIDVNSELEKTHVKCSTAINLCPTKKRRQRQKTKVDKPIDVIVEDNTTVKKKDLETVVHNNSDNNTSEFLDKRSNRNEIIQQYHLVSLENVQTQNDILIKSINTNLKQIRSSNNLNLIETFTNETDFKNSHAVLTCSDEILSEDEIPLKRLAEKWKREKLEIVHFKQSKRRTCSDENVRENHNLHHKLETKLQLTNNSKNPLIDLEKEIITQYSNNENGKIELQTVSLDNGNIMFKECETLKHFNENLENQQKPVDHKTKNQSNKLEFNKSIDGLPKFMEEVSYTNNKGNDEEKIKYTEEIVVDQTKNKMEIFDENYNKPAMTRDFNQTMSTTLGVKRKRKLYNPENLTYLEDSVLDVLPTKFVQIKLPIQPGWENFRLNKCTQFKTNADTVVSLNNSDITIKKSPKFRTVKTPVQADGKSFGLNNLKKFKETKDTIVSLIDCDTNRSCKRGESLKTPRKLKVLNPNTVLKVHITKQKCYSRLRRVFYNIMESYRNEVGTSFNEFLEELIPKKGRMKRKKCMRNTTETKFAIKNNLTRATGMDIHTQKPDVSSSSSSNSSLNLTKKMCLTSHPHTTLSSRIHGNNHVLPESHTEKDKRGRKINIISDIQIRPKRILFEDSTEPKRKKIKTSEFELKSNLENSTEFKKIAEPVQTEKFQCEKIRDTRLPVISESITRKEISSWIITGSPKYSQFSEKCNVLKLSYPMFKSLLTPLDSSQEYKDVLKIFQILKKYH